MSEEQLEEARAHFEADSSNEYEVWPEHAEVVQVFLAMEKQWHKRIIGKNLIWESLRYEALKTVMWGLDIEMSQTLFNDLQTMEQAALTILNEKLN